MRVAALVLGAGRGERLALAVPKAFVPLAGRPLLAHALEALLACEAIERVVPVVPSEWCGRLAGVLGPTARHVKLAVAVAGGATRQDSLAAGLAALPRDFALVAVHDAARPFVSAEAIARVIAAARAHGAALLAAPAPDTIKRVRGGVVVETPPRDECFAAQTPQVFRADWLREGVEKAAAEGRVATDCSQLVEALGVRVHVVEGDAGNRKITDAADLAWAERRLAGGGA
jgi:2-C-methyl-D-erythritol 4-phosphate cytidylyltransferase